MTTANNIHSRYVIEKLNNDNYAVWAYKMEWLLRREKLWSVISDTVKTDETWIASNEDAMGSIALNVSDNQITHIRNAKNAKEAWQALKDYHQKASVTSICYLLKQLCCLKLEEGGDVEQHIMHFVEITDKLEALGETLKDKHVAMMLLVSLPSSYDALVTALENKPDAEFNMDLVKAKLRSEYLRRKGQLSNLNSETEVANKITNKDQSRGESKTCFFCKKIGHLKPDCRKFAKWKKKQEQKKQTAKNVTEGLEFCNMAYFDKMTLDYALLSNVKDRSNSWFIDSGATSHMANSEKFFTKIDSCVEGIVQLADKTSFARSYGRGSIVLKCVIDDNNTVTLFELHNVLYVPQLSSNLISVSTLDKSNFDIRFHHRKCQIFQEGEIKAIAPLYDLYEIQQADKAYTAVSNRNMISKHCQHSWHRIFGHRDVNAIKQLINKELAVGIKIEKCNKDISCVPCIKGKITRKPFPKQSGIKSLKILDMIHTDVCGPLPTITPSGKRFILTIIDDFSRYSHLYLLKYKSEVFTKIQEFIAMVEITFQRKPAIVRSDRGGEYYNNSLQDYFKTNGIRMQYTAAYTPEQNGVAERKNRSLIEMTRCMLIDANLNKKYWGEAVLTANYLQNRLPSRAIDKTPFELWHLRKPDVSHLQIFGKKAYVHIPKEQRLKLDSKADEYIFVGYSEESKAYRLLDVNSDKIKISRDVIFNNLNDVQESKGEIKTSTKPELSEEVEVIISNKRQEEEFIHDNNDETSSENSFSSTNNDNESSEEANLPDTQDSVNIRRSERNNKGVPPDYYIASAKMAIQEDPKTRNEALAREDRNKWIEAMNEEISSLNDNKTWNLVKKPANVNIVSCKWVFKTKRNLDGSINKYKARLVARGFSQKYGTDYDEVFAPVVRHTTFRTLLTIAGMKNMKTKQYDAKTAFLNGDLTEEIFMTQPEGYIQDNKQNMVCKLTKSLYGLKQAAKVWNDKLKEILKRYDFQQSETDPCLFIKDFDKDDVMYLIIYVDDFIIACKNENKIKNTVQLLKKHFVLSDLGDLQYYLGIKIQRDKEGIFYISQPQYIDALINRFGLQDAKISAIPLDTGYEKARLDSNDMKENSKYQQLIGGLLYVSLHTRPDITAAVTILSQHNVKPSEADWVEAKRVLRYLKGTKNLVLKLSGDNNSERDFHGFADADWAQNMTDRKSNSGYIFKFNGSPISWSCKKQTCVSLSSTEAEYIALADACQEALWLKRLLQDFGMKKDSSIIIFEDNQSCLNTIQNNKFSNRTKHIDTKYNFIKDLYKEKTMEFKYCPTEYMLADLFTKPLNKVKLCYMRNACNVKEIKNSSSRKGVGYR